MTLKELSGKPQLRPGMQLQIGATHTSAIAMEDLPAVSIAPPKVTRVRVECTDPDMGRSLGYQLKNVDMAKLTIPYTGREHRIQC